MTYLESDSLEIDFDFDGCDPGCDAIYDAGEF